MELRCLILFMAAFFIACDAQSSTDASIETSPSSAPPVAITSEVPKPTQKELPSTTLASEDKKVSSTPAEDTAKKEVEPTQPLSVQTTEEEEHDEEEEEMQKDAPAAEPPTTTMETKTEKPEEKPTTEAAPTTTKASTMVEPTRMKVKGTSTEPPLVHSISTEAPKQESSNATKKPESGKSGQNASSPIHSSATLIILGLMGFGILRYQSN